MKPICIHNATVATEDRVINSCSLLIEDGVISRIFTDNDPQRLPTGTLTINGEGQLVFPGIIDLHTDAIEREMSPRPGAEFPVHVALRELERKMCGVGYSYVYHSLYLGYTPAWGGSKRSRKKVFDDLHDACRKQSLIHNKIHLRFEITGIHELETCMELIRQNKIHLLSIMDHTPGQGQFNIEVFLRKEQESGASLGEAKKKLQGLLSAPKITEEQLESMLLLAKTKGIPVASHDDDHPQKVARMLAKGVSICEFPIDKETARFAVSKKMATIGGAANVLNGGSLSGNLNVAEAIGEGLINCLCSDYYPPALLHAIFKLHKDYNIPFDQIAKLVSLNSAHTMGLSHFTGSIKEGKSADIIMIKQVDEVPMVSLNMVGGNVVFAQNSKNSLHPMIDISSTENRVHGL